MADIKFTELVALTASTVASNDILAIVDTDASASKKLTIANLYGQIPTYVNVADTTNSTSNTTGALKVAGGAGFAKSVTIGENLTVHGNTIISGNLTFGDAATDTITMSADLASNLIPDANGTRNIGSASMQWGTVHANNITVPPATINSTTILVNTTMPLYFRDDGLSLSSPTNGTLDIAADTILEITAPTMNVVSTTVDFDANVTIHSTFSANSTAALMGTTLPLYFRDDGLSLSSPTNGTLDIAADTILEITAPTTNVIATTVDFDANVVIHSTFSANSTVALMGTDKKLLIRDTGIHLSSPTDGTLDIAADGILEITAPTTNVIATTALTIHTPAITANGTVSIGASADGYDVTLFGATAASTLLWDESADSMVMANSYLTISDTRTSVAATRTGITVDMYNKLDTGSSYDRLGGAISSIGDTGGYTIRDCIGVKAISKNSDGAEVTRLNAGLWAVLDFNNTTSANNSGTTLSGAYGVQIDHDNSGTTRTGQPTAFLGFGEKYTGGTTSVETAYFMDIFTQGKTGDATWGTSANVAFYQDKTADTYGGATLQIEAIAGGIIQEGFALEDGDGVLLLDDDTTVTTGTAEGKMIAENSSADGVLKLRVNGETKYIQLYNNVGDIL